RSDSEVSDGDRFAVEIDGKVLQQHDAASVEELAPHIREHCGKGAQRKRHAADVDQGNAVAPERLDAGHQLIDVAAAQLVAPGSDVAQVLAAACRVDDALHRDGRQAPRTVESSKTAHESGLMPTFLITGPQRARSALR